MNVLIVDGGGRGHALAWKIAKSPKVKRVMVSPRNIGCGEFASLFDVRPDDVMGLADLAESEHADLTIVGPEAPLAAGIVEEFSKRRLPIFGPSSKAAKIESSKWWAKEFMAKYEIPTADAKLFTSPSEAAAYVKTLREGSHVIKASGLAAGKGVVVPNSSKEAESALTNADSVSYPSSNSPVIIEDRMFGKEVSVFAFVDGETVSEEVAACDYKRVGEGDIGPNTGGVGSFAPPYFWSEELAESVKSEILLPTARGLVNEGIPYKGVLYAGLMVTDEGPKVIEFNCRFGDPECQTILPLLSTDLLEICLAVAEGRLSDISVEWISKPCVTVVLFSQGYPGKYDIHKEITGLEEASHHAIVFHAGTALGDKGRTVTAGGRVLGITGEGNSIQDAVKNAYDAAACIKFEGMQMRRDIAANAVSL